MGNRLIGVRANDAEVSQHLRRVLEAHAVPGVEAPPNLSLLLGTQEGRIRDLHVLYRSGRSVLRTRSRARLLRATVAHLDSFARDLSELTMPGARLVVRDGMGVVVDGALAGVLDRIESRIKRFGYRVVDVPDVKLDQETLEIVQRPIELTVDHEALAALDDDESPNGAEAILSAPNRVPVAAVVVWAREAPGEPSPGQRFSALTRLFVPPERTLTGTDLERAGRLFRDREVLSCDADAVALVGALRGISENAP